MVETLGVETMDSGVDTARSENVPPYYRGAAFSVGGGRMLETNTVRGNT